MITDRKLINGSQTADRRFTDC